MPIALRGFGSNWAETFFSCNSGNFIEDKFELIVDSMGASDIVIESEDLPERLTSQSVNQCLSEH
jgi:hypothetical protein